MRVFCALFVLYSENRKKGGNDVKSILILIQSLLLIIALLVSGGCGKDVNGGTDSSADESGQITESTPESSVNNVENKDGVIVGDVEEGDKALVGDMAEGDAVYEAVPEEAPAEDIIDGGYFIGEQQPQSGTLTAGELKDNENYTAWKKLLDDGWNQLCADWELSTQNRVKVTAHTENGTPVTGAEVMLKAADSGKIFSAITNASGVAYVFYGADVVPQEITLIGMGEEHTVPFESDKASYDFVCIEAKAQTKLDLMFMVDTTGSMGDELSYLKAEVQELINRSSATGMAVRTSVNFYRDTTDEYVVKYFAFESDPEKVKANVAAQYAAGGGDYEEAVHTALSNAVYQHAWDNDSVKIMFLLLDAPPHKEAQIISEISKTVSDAASMGIRIIPVASSGINKESEFLFRSYAMLTGGSYAFLTDTSGVGGSHLEPSADQYGEELLVDLMTRLIYEYCGMEYEAPEYEIGTQPENSGEQTVEYSDDVVEVTANDTINGVIPRISAILAGTVEIGAAKNEGFVNIDICPIETENQAAERATLECTVDYDTVTAVYDGSDGVWAVHFYLSDTAGGDQIVYMNKNGETLLIIYGE